MEGAGKLVEDEELREAMSEKGLGTPATRAAIIEGLIYEKYIAAQSARIAAHGQGVFPDHPAAGVGHSRVVVAGIDGRLGIQAQANGARANWAGPNSCGKSQEMTRQIVRKAKAA